MSLVNSLLIAVAGGSAAGKTCVAKGVAGLLLPLTTRIISQDCYYLGLKPGLPTTANYNFDHPDAIDWSLLRTHLVELKKGNSVDVPTYDFTTHSRARSEKCEPADVLILEGTLILSQKEIREILDYSVFLQVSEKTRLERRCARDIIQRGRTIESVLNQFEKTVRPMHEMFVQASSLRADLILDDSTVEFLSARIVSAIPNRFLAPS